MIIVIKDFLDNKYNETETVTVNANELQQLLEINKILKLKLKHSKNIISSLHFDLYSDTSKYNDYINLKENS